ncbi:MAG: GMC family oxidoreductase [Acidobacteria bacterium]|nr:GMC family oxidoreductase [Acidobacteriota bacterium]
MQVKKQAKVYDVVVIGSGASGGMAAWNLTRQGVNVLLLDAGGRFDRSKFWTHVLPYEARERQARGEHAPQFYLSKTEQPVLTPPDQPFDLIRVWGVGGKTNVWGRVSLRYSDVDFKVNDGYGISWPIEYKDIKPYYDKVDQLIGVNGGDEDLDVLPGSKFHMPPPRPRCGEMILKKSAASVGIQIVSGRRAVMTRNHNGWPACHYCGRCGAGCDTGSFFNSADHLLPVAAKTGKLEIRTNAVVARILTDKEGKASGVQYFDRNTKAETQVRARVVVLGASAIDSTRILLNSKSAIYPNGIGNTSGVIGKYLCEQFRFHARAFLPQLFGQATSNDDGIGGEHIYMPRFNHRGAKRDYARGFGMQFWGIGCQTNAGWGKGLPGFGADLKANVRKRYPSWIELHPYGEVPPRAENRVEVDETKTDKYGVPLPKLIMSYGDNEQKMMKEMYDTTEQILHAAKAEIVQFKRGDYDIPGTAIHEHGTCRMGSDPKTSALNSFNQMHAVKNLFVVDGSSFPSATEKNPTLTILAIAWRASDYLAEQMKRGNL